MKAIIQYDLSNEKDLFDRAQNVMKYYYSIEEHLSFLRDKIKYESLSQNEVDVLITVRDNLHQILESYGIHDDF